MDIQLCVCGAANCTGFIQEPDTTSHLHKVARPVATKSTPSEKAKQMKNAIAVDIYNQWMARAAPLPIVRGPHVPNVFGNTNADDPLRQYWKDVRDRLDIPMRERCKFFASAFDGQQGFIWKPYGTHMLTKSGGVTKGRLSRRTRKIRQRRLHKLGIWVRNSADLSKSLDSLPADPPLGPIPPPKKTTPPQPLPSSPHTPSALLGYDS
jgi:hypothetical protein